MRRVGSREGRAGGRGRVAKQGRVSRQQWTHLFDGRPVFQDVDLLQHVHNVWTYTRVKEAGPLQEECSKAPLKATGGSATPHTHHLGELAHGDCAGGASFLSF